MARRDITGAVDFPYLEAYAANDSGLIEEVLALFVEQAALWSPLLDPTSEGWRDAAHTLKGAARGIGANAVGAACEAAEQGRGSLGEVKHALDLALMDIAAYRHERALKSLRG